MALIAGFCVSLPVMVRVKGSARKLRILKRKESGSGDSNTCSLELVCFSVADSDCGAGESETLSAGEL